MDVSPAIQLIEKAKHVGLILPQDPDTDVLASAEVLIQFLVSRGIYVGIITRLNPASFVPQHPFSALRSLKSLTKEFIISLDTTHAPISQLRYEHTDGRVDIIISPSTYSIPQDHISFREGNTQCDCIIALGVNDTGQINTVKQDNPSPRFSETPVISMDISEKPNNHAEINLIDSTLSSLAELVYRFLVSSPDYTIPKDSATLLLSGILHRTKDFSMLAHADTLLLSRELIGLGAQYETARNMSRTSLPFSITPLIGRAFARSRMDEQKKIAWSLVTNNDFTLTHCLPQDIPGILDYIKKEFSLARVCILLWQDPYDQHIRVRIAADTQLLELICQKMKTQRNGMHAQLTDIYDSFPDAERAVRALLDAVL